VLDSRRVRVKEREEQRGRRVPAGAERELLRAFGLPPARDESKSGPTPKPSADPLGSTT
jgi:hypothetical protein